MNLYRHVMVTPDEDMRHSLDRRLADHCCNPELFPICGAAQTRPGDVVRDSILSCRRHSVCRERRRSVSPSSRGEAGPDVPAMGCGNVVL